MVQEGEFESTFARLASGPTLARIPFDISKAGKPHPMSLTREKLDQAAGLVASSDIDVWLTFVRETAMGGDPVLPLILNGGLTWQSALIVSRSGRRIAIVGNYDADPLEASGDWDEVVRYVQSIRESLIAELESLVSHGGRIGVNFSLDNEKSDGLTHGMFLQLERYLAGTRFEGSLVSADPIVSALRGQKTHEEIRRMKMAISATDQMFEDIASFARIGVTERAVYDHVHRLARERGLGFSWDPVGDPIVNSGPDSMIGHGIPSETITIQSGHIFHIDLGLIVDEYSSDIQRSWYVADSGEPHVPEDVQRAFDAIHGAISAGVAVMKPGSIGKDVDLAARQFLTDAGYPEYMHAFGHQVGRAAHDGGALLGPEWDRYGRAPLMPLQANQVFTAELGVELPGRGYLGLEEMVRVTDNGVEWLTNRQNEILVLG